MLPRNKPLLLFVGVIATVLFLLFLSNRASRFNADGDNYESDIVLNRQQLHSKILQQWKNFKDPFSIVITGGMGFIASHLVEYLYDTLDEIPQLEHVFIVDNLETGFTHNVFPLFSSNKKQEGVYQPYLSLKSELSARDVPLQVLHPKFVFVEASIEKTEMWQQLYSFAKKTAPIKMLFHFAAKLSVAESMSKPLEYERVNVQAMISMLQLAKQNQVQKIVFSSSAAVFGSDPTVPKVETMKPAIESSYAQTKLTGEFYLKMFSSDTMKTVALRYFNVFGERQNPNSAYAAAIPNFLKAAIEGNPIQIFGDGEQTRDFVYVKDVILANVYTALFSDAPFEIYNVGYGTSTTLNKLIERIVQSMQSLKIVQNRDDIKIVYKDPRPGDVKHSMASNRKLRELGWRQSYSFDDALMKTIQYFKNHLKH